MKEKERKMSVPFSSSFVLCIKKKLNLKKNKQKKTFGIFFFSHHFFLFKYFLQNKYRILPFEGAERRI
jgi:hypothetical protein